MSLTRLEYGSELVLHWSINESAARVWQHLTDKELLPAWLGRFLDSDGASFRIGHGDGYICESRMLGFDPASRRMEFTWKFPDEHETVLSVDVRSEGDGAMLVLQHADLGALRESYEPGWLTHLTYFEASLGATPLPKAQFWNFYGTFNQLVRRN